MNESLRKPLFGLSECATIVDGVISALGRLDELPHLATFMSDLAIELGFRYFALIHHEDLRTLPVHRVKVLEYPAAIEHRIIAQAQWRRDPVIRACNFTHQAFAWSRLAEIISLDKRDRACLAEGERHGLNTGITVPFHLLGESLGSCTFAGLSEPDQVTRLVGTVQMIGIFAFQTARRLVGATCKPAAPPRLHPRPRDCITLVARGMSNKQIARALSLTPRTVDGYLTEARELFDAQDRTSLAFSAVLAGEISLHEMLRRKLGLFRACLGAPFVRVAQSREHANGLHRRKAPRTIQPPPFRNYVHGS